MLRDKLISLKDKLLEKVMEDEFIKDVEGFMNMSNHDQNYYNDLLKYKKQLHDNYSLVNATKQIELEDLLWKKIKQIDAEIDYYNKIMKEGVA